MRIAVLAVVIALGLAAFGVVSGTAVYLERRTEILELQQAISASWQEADAVVQERADLAPGLIRAIQPYATREREVIQRVRDARSALEAAFTVPDRIQTNRELSDALAALLAVAEEYPELLSKPEYKRLQDEFATVENRAAAQRRKYNQQVQDYNTRLQLFPSNFVAYLEGFEREEAYFRTSEQARQAPPVVNFTPAAQAPAEKSDDEPE